jgi:hypothetical protein
MGNQYGLDMGNILSTESAIKSARLNQKAKQLEIDKEEAGNVLRKNYLDTATNTQKAKEFKIGQEAGIEGPMEQPTETLPQEEVNRLSAIAPDATANIQKQQQLQARQQSLKKMYVAQGESEDVADYKSNMDIKDVVDFEKMYVEKDKATQENIRNGMAQQGRYIDTIIKTSKQDPQAANQMFLNYKTDQLKNINELRKQGKNKEADQIEAGLKRTPESLIDANGNFNVRYLTVSLGKLSSALTTAESYQKEQEAEMKQDNALALESRKQSNRMQVERARANRPSGTNKKEFQQLMDELQKETDPDRKQMIQNRITKLTQPEMTSLLTNVNTVKEAQSTFAQRVGLDDPYKLATVDTRKWTPEQRAEADQVSSLIVKGLGANAKEADKKMAEFESLSTQMQNAISGYEQVGSFRLADETVKQYFSNYFGLSEKELESSEAASAFQSMLNIKIKADSGSAVSGNEMVRNTLETASPYMSKDKILLGIKNVAKRQIGALNGLKKTMGPVAFNLKYGTTLSNYEDIVNATDTKEVKKSDKGFIKVDDILKQDGRDAMYNQIKTQRPNATPEQINAYLTSKGY